MIYVYVGCLTFGIAYAVISAILGGHGFDHGGMDGPDMGGADAGGMDLGGADLDGVDISSVDIHGGGDSADAPSPFNPMVIASAIATFGAIGIIGKAGFAMGDLASALVALSFAGAIGVTIFFGVVKFMYSSQSDSTFSLNDLVGIEAEVITPVPEKGMGEVAYTIRGMRYSLPAKSLNSQKIERGCVVRIKEIVGNTAVVSQKVSIEDLDRMEDSRRQQREKE